MLSLTFLGSQMIPLLSHLYILLHLFLPLDLMQILGCQEFEQDSEGKAHLSPLCLGPQLEDVKAEDERHRQFAHLPVWQLMLRRFK